MEIIILEKESGIESLCCSFPLSHLKMVCAARFSASLGNNLTTATHILPITSTTLTNLGISLTGSTAMGFTIGILKG
jgi:hypothetical protein